MDTLICGIDEAGRGPLAGPVTAAAVILYKTQTITKLNDSKKLTDTTRRKLVPEIKTKALAWSVAWVWPWEIDKINIHNGSLLAMQRAFEKLQEKYDFDNLQKDRIEVLVDGKWTPQLPVPSKAVIGGDSTIPEIMAASIIAKVHRDRLMEKFATFYRAYSFEKHKGYPTKAHREAIRINGPCHLHRRSFTLLPSS